MSARDESTRFFIGVEVEHTPTFNQPTLFVVGLQPVAEIEQQLTEHPVRCIYFGANQSYTGTNFMTWSAMISHFLQQGYWCTLDLDVALIQDLLESVLVEHNRFIPMISVKLPYIQQLGYNAVVKLDDVGFNRTNPGVWCHQIHALMSHDHFTHWGQYNDDQPV